MLTTPVWSISLLLISQGGLAVNICHVAPKRWANTPSWSEVSQPWPAVIDVMRSGVYNMTNGPDAVDHTLYNVTPAED